MKKRIVLFVDDDEKFVDDDEKFLNSTGVRMVIFGYMCISDTLLVKLQ